MTFIKGQKAWNKGKKGRQRNHNTSGFALGHGWNKGKKGYLAGNKHYNWKGGVSKLAKLIWETFEYQQWRSRVFERDNWTCQTCGRRGYVEAHHIRQLYLILKENIIKTMEQARDCKELWDINNGVALCRDCHKLTFKNQSRDL